MNQKQIITTQCKDQEINPNGGKEALNA